MNSLFHSNSFQETENAESILHPVKREPEGRHAPLGPGVPGQRDLQGQRPQPPVRPAHGHVGGRQQPRVQEGAGPDDLRLGGASTFR